MGLFDFLKPDPIKALEQEIRKRGTRSMELQRNGDLRGHAAAEAELAQLEQRLNALRAKANE